MTSTVTESRLVLEPNKDKMSEPNVLHNTGRWTGEEHNRFLQGLQTHGKVWKSIATVVKTRSIVQVRTHAQKYFMKMSRGDGSIPGKVTSTSTAKEPKSTPSMEKRDTPCGQKQTARFNQCKQWSATGNNASNIPKSKSFDMYNKSGYYARDSTKIPASTEKSPSSKPRARKFDEIDTSPRQTKASTTSKSTEKPKKRASQTKAKAPKKPSKSSKTNVPTYKNKYQPQPMSYYGGIPSTGMTYSNSYPSLNDRVQGGNYTPKKVDGRSNKRARITKTGPRGASQSNYMPMGGNTTPSTMGENHQPSISHPVSCPDFSYFSHDVYSKTEVVGLNEHIPDAVASIPCESESEDNLEDLEKILMKENLLSSAKKDWRHLEDDKVSTVTNDFLKSEADQQKMDVLECNDLKLKVPGNEGFSLPQKYSPTSVMEPCATWAALSYPDFGKEKESDLIVEDDGFLPMNNSNDENNLFWFGDGSFDDLLETM